MYPLFGVNLARFEVQTGAETSDVYKMTLWASVDVEWNPSFLS